MAVVIPIPIEDIHDDYFEDEFDYKYTDDYLITDKNEYKQIDNNFLNSFQTIIKIYFTC